ncbi:hypothetical protein M595_5260 [Lyngbya aestuarii BL J]|uniref:Uncharacterized protein n=1 Tax=Lyngbya aestuarii BL J TaxID=1348334 RepID=U7QAC1_9CYAN|nr:hypothetical protein M595_5260 [Lyngbya aestuarii BL J]
MHRIVLKDITFKLEQIYQFFKLLESTCFDSWDCPQLQKVKACPRTK